jgi:hypothetical protein
LGSLREVYRTYEKMSMKFFGGFLAVNRYSRGEAQLALTICLEGNTEEPLQFASEMKEIPEERFSFFP